MFWFIIQVAVKFELLLPSSTSGPFDIRLMGGTKSAQHYSGRVEVRRGSGNWGTICDDDFDNREASVICKMFGYPYGIIEERTHVYFGAGNGTIFMDDLNCTGNETSVFDCQYSGWGNSNCEHYEDAGVRCFSFDRGNCHTCTRNKP